MSKSDLYLESFFHDVTTPALSRLINANAIILTIIIIYCSSGKKFYLEPLIHLYLCVIDVTYNSVTTH